MNVINNVPFRIVSGLKTNGILRGEREERVERVFPAVERLRRDSYEFINKNELVDSMSGTYVSSSAAYALSSIYQSDNFYSTSIPKSQMAANRAGIASTPGGSPIINSGADYNAYDSAMNWLNKFKPINTYNCFSDDFVYRPISCGKVTDTVFTQDHQYFLYALTADYDSAAKSYYAEQGYSIDAYMLMGIGFGESNASKSSSNPFGALASLNSSGINKAANRAIQALQDCELASTEADAKKWMDSDPFYQKAAEVLSYMDNGYSYGLDLKNVYETADQANKNAGRWRYAAAAGSTNEEYFAYYYYK